MFSLDLPLVLECGFVQHPTAIRTNHHIDGHFASTIWTSYQFPHLYSVMQKQLEAVIFMLPFF